MKTLILGVLTYFAGTLGYIALAQSSTSVPPADSRAGSVAGAVVGDAPSAASNDWPFIIIRHTPAINAAPEVFARLMESHFRYPRACDEFWFAATGRGTKEATLEEMKKADAAFRPLCEKAGIKFSFQQGVTLGHGDVCDASSEQHFSADAYQVGKDGSRSHRVCPRSAEVLAHEKELVKAVLEGCAPDSYWLDDDLRIGVPQLDRCFCDRCIEAFNKKTGGKWTRQTLVKNLFSKKERERVRAQWIEFNEESLAIYAAKAREAANELKSPVRLAYQAVWSDTIYTGYTTKKLLEAISGPERKSVGIRPGATFYVEASPREMISKALSVAREAERCRDWGSLVSSVCYEQETYPRHVLHKTPGAIMTECALALASGCNSLSLYWYSHSAPEPIEDYDWFVKTLDEARAYFERLAASTRRTRLGGIARFVGSAAAETRDFDLRDKKDFDLACAGIPVTVAESGTKVVYLTQKSRAEMTRADREKLKGFSVVDVSGVETYPIASCRTKLLDEIDKASGGLFPVRIDKCRALRILPRVREDGRLDSVTIINLSIGETDELKIRVRRPVSTNVVLQTPKMAKGEAIKCEKGASDFEHVVTVSSIPAWQVVTLFFQGK